MQEINTLKIMGIFVVTILVSLIVISLLVYFLIKINRKRKELNDVILNYEKKYGRIINIDKAIEKRRVEFTKERDDTLSEIKSVKEGLGALKLKYQKAKEVFDDLSLQNNLLNESLEISEYGVYKPFFDFETSEKFKEEINRNKEKQKECILKGMAAVSGTPWSVDGSRKKGEILERKAIKLTLRAFNGECDSLISRVRWNNIERYEQRLEKNYDAINKLNSSQKITIERAYLDLKMEELRLNYEFQLKKYDEKEEQRRIREQMREEEKAKRDFERAQKEAKIEEKRLQLAMRKVREEMLKSSEEEREKYELEIIDLQNKLQEAEEKNQRAISMAQQTRAGHVYIISNIGSFGEDVFKIGMTRRLEPLDRVNELGGASVPFRFDVHAMIYSEDAPELESELHRAFNNNRVNHINLRREYFKISLDEIERVVKANHAEIEFIKDAEAKEYRESLILRNRYLEKDDGEDVMLGVLAHLCLLPSQGLAPGREFFIFWFDWFLVPVPIFPQI
ncbi:DUF4041 domain-containing protein [Fulvivirga maritima]|uniref:DUF4041 domain-containing protein n=1 Tax=Fulvivirga maritima TaxID=2904247 RepID=UPI001F1C3E76|nr:DUF4041 domain-containing protein [Fulvivirga maritima]UII29200.1 DUF4041 domain-containing protein [Fulvivirga maritima]